MDKWMSEVESQNISVCSVTIILYRPLEGGKDGQVLPLLTRVRARLERRTSSLVPLTALVAPRAEPILQTSSASRTAMLRESNQRAWAWGAGVPFAPGYHRFLWIIAC